MDKYKKLINNSIIFAIGNLGSKFLQFILVPLYSFTLSTADFGTADFLTQLVYLLTPIVSLELYDAVFRYALDKNEDKFVLFNTVSTVLLVVSLIAFLVSPIFANIFDDYHVYSTVIFLIANICFAFLSNFVRAIGYVREFAIAGIVNTFFMGIFSVIFLVVFKLGLVGYLMSFSIGLVAGCIYIVLSTHISRFIGINNFNKLKLFEMLKYSLPLIPNYFAWWLNSTSDRLFIITMISASANGIYAMATKIPNLINLLTMVFSQSWQISIVEEYKKKNSRKFVSNVFTSFFSILIISGILIIVSIKPIYWLFLDKSYYNGWRLTPLLVLAVIYSGLALLLEGVYTAYKKTFSVLVTTIWGAIINIVLTIILIPIIGIYGAALANVISFLIVTIMRMFEIRRLGLLVIDIKRILIYHLAFFIVTFIALKEESTFMVIGVGVIMVFLLIIFDRNIIHQLRIILNKKK
ncbi:lipopolysaccharide biosynthesis protein [Limosilactobacillus vaginalis]|uniref:lipopolysaccharide biosynthesis protein n=1 Tax=Limosilactobacillus vaginalis TaxID=1633 RepID=UPI0025A3E129|nr:oligosaccharide flippase family protein [Limosilactobacillus vaginalis]MDM8303798.1 oligosaccharide flippase family protein [Limosilactobacillus vaginalis]